MKESIARLGLAAGILTAAALGPIELAAQSADEQIAQAVLPLPEYMRAGAKVMGYAGGELRLLRDGEGSMVCLADDPDREGFHVACYHESLEPFMARGRELRAGGMNRREALAKRWEEIDAETLEMPEHPAALYTLTSREGQSGPEHPEKLFRVTVIYTPYATAEDVGLPTDPKEGLPWLMFPGRPSAHVMIHEPIGP
ncbi:MAG: hypothetical protein ACE5HP_05295 [Gemmatimonadota bacterium]